ncbi:MAG: imidazolonepropionase [Myxococcales bacterium]
MAEATIIDNAAQVLTMVPRLHAAPLLGIVGERQLGVIPGGSVLVEGGRVTWVGPAEERPARASAARRLDARGGVVMPGLVDSHTHAVHAGSRELEFALRCAGETYEQIARRGGGIRVTTAATRAASEDDLVAGAARRLDRMLTFGVTTVEIKSGYGLCTEAELAMLRAIRRLGAERPQTIVPTFLGAHTVPAGADRAAYVDEVVEEMLPAVATQGLARFCDVFCEETAFTVPESRRILERAAALGLGLKVHAEQLHHTGATALAVELGALSADHLEEVDDRDVALLAESGTVATLLPGATLFLGQRRKPPARRLLDAGVKVALATDCNPGSCPTENLPLMATLGCVQLGMSPAEALLGITLRGAEALGLGDTHGHLGEGARGDVLVTSAPSWLHLCYHFGVSHTRAIVAGGALVWTSPEGT